MQALSKIELFLVFSALVFSFSGCKNPAPAKPDKEVIVRKIDPVLDQIFNDRYPAFKSNGLVKAEAVVALEQKIDSLVPLNYLDDIPLRIFRIVKNPDGAGAVVHFYSDNEGYLNKQPLSSFLAFDVFAYMPEEKAAELNEKDEKFRCFIKGKFSRISESKVKSITGTTYYGSKTEIEQDALYKNRYTFSIGWFSCRAEEVKQVVISPRGDIVADTVGIK